MSARIAILGASGYAGREVLRLVQGHPSLEAAAVMSARRDHTPPPPALPHDSEIAALDIAALENVDGVFVCAPHGVSFDLVRAAHRSGAKVVDLSADFRLRDVHTYESVYATAHGAPDLLEHAVYGLPEHARDQIARATLVANPGCYPTAVALPLLPLLAAGLIDPEPGIIADCKSGVSGAGTAPKARTHFGATHENFCAYGVGDHRHAPEIWQTCGTDRIVFTPHLLPVFRGILATLHCARSPGASLEDIRDCLSAHYADEPFVRLYERGLPELDRVQRTNFCDIAVRDAGAADRIVIISAIDNLMKGAAGQAVQNMNLLLGIPETAGLL